ncbi:MULTISPECIES: hypothetical protein [Enterocloster]|uniref:hypothetical protein n=1 Tax=Enterocloster TaxID=2719313 RepID=UPI00210DC6BD|nr:MULTISPECIES: hypothetical protein [Enterocloster]MCQ5144855.1 hypothetical protein [Enterocloster bolteae]
MEKSYCLGTVEEDLFMMDFDYLSSDIAEIETPKGSKTLIISVWSVSVPELGVNVYLGAVCKEDGEMGMLPELYVTIIRAYNESLWLYYEEADIITTLFHWLKGQYSKQMLEGMPCYLWGPDLESVQVKNHGREESYEVYD